MVDIVWRGKQLAYIAHITKGKAMSNEAKYAENIRQFIEEVSGRNHKECLDKFCSQDMILYNRDKTFNGLEAVKEANQNLIDAVPDLRYTLEDLIVQGEIVAIRWRARGKAVKDYGDFKAGESADHWGLSQFQFKDGLIYKNWCNASKQDLFR